MTKRIFHSICLVAVSVFLASLALIMGVLYDYFSKMQKDQLKIQTDLAARGVANEGMAYFDGPGMEGCRITWIGADGSILYETDSDASAMENHLNRSEVRQALEEGYGESLRYSDTLTERYLYAARRLPDGSVIRLSGTQYTVWVLLMGISQPILIVAVFAVFLSLALAHHLSAKIVKPLNEINLDEPGMEGAYQEIEPLLGRIGSQRRQLRQQALRLKQKQDEFDAVTASLKEGLVLLDTKGTILSFNSAASHFFSISDGGVGRDILTFQNSVELQELLRRAGAGACGETTIKQGERGCRLSVSPVISGGEVTGIALLIFDITEKEKAERMRREFTANVTHELKTPLHSISGYAELMKNQMVRAEDVEHFSERIYTEVQRLISLVDDIICLSRLDEGAANIEREEVDLYALVKQVCGQLWPKAEAAGVELVPEGETALLNGATQLLRSIIFNLCDNAVKYNRRGGSVFIEVRGEKEEILLRVRDTGIGIPREHQERIFERFYRVDKSHCTEVRGTGLGLSIVRHGARLHDARIELESVVGSGTTVTVRFPFLKG